jgi:hypothetical protein
MSVGVDILLDTEKTRLITLLGVNTEVMFGTMHFPTSFGLAKVRAVKLRDVCGPVRSCIRFDVPR